MTTASGARISDLVAALIAQEKLPEHFAATVERHFLPLAARIAHKARVLNVPLRVGINGAQGTGKSTLALFLRHLLSDCHGLPCASFSLDDIYLTHAQRAELARTIHPLLQTRGVPGTHDLSLGQRTVDALIHAEEKQITPIPAFDKATDDRAPLDNWPRFQGPARIVLIEGWCVGVTPQPDLWLDTPINALERNEDSDGHWRHYVNQTIAESYAPFFAALDWLIMLQAPSMECVAQWRTLQEQKLARQLLLPHPGAIKNLTATNYAELVKEHAPDRRIMSPKEIQRFVMHYERLTCWMLEEMPARADTLFTINEHHDITGVIYHDLPQTYRIQ